MHERDEQNALTNGHSPSEANVDLGDAHEGREPFIRGKGRGEVRRRSLDASYAAVEVAKAKFKAQQEAGK